MRKGMEIPKEGALHSIVTIDAYTFELRYGYCDDRDRLAGEPYLLYPDLLTAPRYTAGGSRIVTALQSVCRHYQPVEGQEQEDCCYTCRFYPDFRAEIGVCQCDAQRLPSGGQNSRGGAL